MPALSQTFDTANFYDWQTSLQSFDGEEGARLANGMLDEAEEELDDAVKVLPLHARTGMAALRARLDAARALAQGTADADARRGAAEEARLVRQAIAAARAHPEARAAVLRRELADQVRWYDGNVRPNAPERANDQADQLAKNARSEIDTGTPDGFDLADSLTTDLNRLYWTEGMRQPGFCAARWRWVRAERHLMRDKAGFDAVLAKGDAQLAAGDMEGLRGSLRAMWDNKVSSGRQRDVGRPADVLRE